MSDFFISYTQADRAWAEWIAWILKENGYTVVVQAWDFRPGSDFIQNMHQATQECERTVVVLSPSYQDSHFAGMEWAAALAQKKKLLPVRVQEVKPTGLLAGIVYIDLVGADVATARDKLLGGLKESRVMPSSEPPFPGTPGPRFPADLAALPLAEIPARGPLPPGSRMPFAANPLFVGREEDLRTLARQLKAGETAAVGQVEIAAATGLGGIGKTQLACEFVHRYGQYFDGGVFWMSFADPATVPTEVAAYGHSFKLHPSYNIQPLDQQTRLVEEAWTRPIPQLLVFDNCEEESLLDRWRPRFGGARVLITSRRSRWDPALGVRALPLDTLPRTASLELLKRFRPDLSKDDLALDKIAAELGDLPLALHLAGSYLQRYAHSPIGRPAAYLAALRQNGLLEHPSLQGQGSPISPTGHAAHVARTFALSFERLNPEDETDALAAALLGRAAHFACGEPIPRDLLLKTVETVTEDPADTRAEDALGRLTALGLLESREEGTLVVHRLVATFARNRGAGEEAQRAVEEALLTEANRLNNAGVPESLLAWQAHLQSVAEGAWEREDTTAAGLANTWGFHLQMIGDFAGARPYYERALAICEKVLVTEHPYTAISLNNLGSLLDSKGDLEGARPYYERALAIREKVLGPEHPDTALSLNNLGSLLRNQGDLAGARPYYERALAIREKVLGPEHPHTATSLNNLGGLLSSQGNLAEARSYYERALAIREKVLGPEHPDAATSLNNLGGLLYSQGNFAEARLYFERALAIFETRLGPNHPSTKMARENLEALGPALSS